MTATKINEADLLSAALQVARLLRQKNLKVVFAESCTAGLIAATMSKIPGISEFLCGSFVTYRNDSKHQWLNVSVDDLDSAEIGPVSETVARQMATGALNRTPEASIAVSVTGHLGPNAPPKLDGLAYSAILFRQCKSELHRMDQVSRIQLDEISHTEIQKKSSARERRQQAAVLCVLQNLGTALETIEDYEKSS